MNARAQLVYRAPKYCHITPFLRELLWLPVCLRGDFKILKILDGAAPSYLKDLVSVLPDSHYQLRRNNNGIVRKTSAKNEEDYGRSRVLVSRPLLMEQSSSANKTGWPRRVTVQFQFSQPSFKFSQSSFNFCTVQF